MKKIYLFSAVALSAILLLAAASRFSATSDGFVVGTPTIKSVNALAFGPDGVLFIGDSKSASVFAVVTNDSQPAQKVDKVEMKNVDQKIAAALGTKPENITIQDIAVNPISKKIYCAVHNSDGTPVLIKIQGENIEMVSLKDIKYAAVSINNAPAEDAKDQRGRPLRVWTISDLEFANGKVMVSGLSNQEFSSTFRSISYPFTNKQDHSSLEIYHAAHGKYETYAPIKTFTTALVNGKEHLIASYTCTPLVLFPMDGLKPGTHVKGRTVAEMGAGNSPLDMITMKKGGDTFLFIANSNRPVFKVKIKSIESFQGELTTPVEENFAAEGVEFVSLPLVNVLQLDKLDDGRFIMLQRNAAGELNLQTSNEWYL